MDSFVSEENIIDYEYAARDDNIDFALITKVMAMINLQGSTMEIYSIYKVKTMWRCGNKHNV